MQAWHLQEGIEPLVELPLDLPEQGFVWLAVDRQELQDQFAEIQARLAHWSGAPLLDLHVSDLLNDELTSHFDYTQAYDLLVLRRLSGTQDVDRIETQAVGFAVYPRVLLTVHPSECHVREHFASRLPTLATPAAGQHRLPSNPDELMLRMLNHMVDSYLELRRLLTKRHSGLQQALLNTRHPFQDWPQLLTARSNLHQLEDLCEDQRAAVQEWLDALAEWPNTALQSERESLRVRARDVIEHIERVLGHAQRLGAATESAVQMHYAALSHRTNNIMRVLTALTAVFLPLNLITGFFGMNFDSLPLIHSATGAWVALGVMAAIALGIAWVFRRKRYISTRI
jgi:magnesium transporter